MRPSGEPHSQKGKRPLYDGRMEKDPWMPLGFLELAAKALETVTLRYPCVGETLLPGTLGFPWWVDFPQLGF